jgi:membrane-bound lytic murein transglycosylase D
MRLLLSLLLSLLCTTVRAAGPPEVPEVLEWCGMRLHLDAAARAAVQTQVNKLCANATYHRTLATRAATYFPFASEALAQQGAPDDLKYLMIQESGVQSDAVSSSLAVGFWQLKDYTAREMGIVVSDAIDERKHITTASVAAARYFLRAYGLYRNWLYCVIAYYEGPTGALPHTDPALYTATEMQVTGALHWYAVKALAHKVAYEASVAATTAPQLAAQSTEGETSVWKLAKQAGCTAEELRKLNTWMGKGPLPARVLSYFVPAAKGDRKPDPLLASYARVELPQVLRPVSMLTQVAPPKQDTVAKQAAVSTPQTPSLPLVSTEPGYEKEYTYVSKGEGMAALALRTGVAEKRLRKYNGWANDYELQADALVLLVPHKEVTAHVLRPQETLESVSLRYHLSPKHVAELNSLVESSILSVGLKLWLRTPAPEAGIRYALVDSVVAAPLEQAPKPLAANGSYTVQKGDTLFRIAMQHGLSADTLRQLNGIRGDALSLGQVLRVR